MLVHVVVAVSPVSLRLLVLSSLVLTLVLVVLPLASLLLGGVLVVLVAVASLVVILLSVLAARLFEGVEAVVPVAAVCKTAAGLRAGRGWAECRRALRAIGAPLKLHSFYGSSFHK